MYRQSRDVGDDDAESCEDDLTQIDSLKAIWIYGTSAVR